jgi:hydroxymethylpyrimidine pyrophosphatase-like HAD family hydrolase
MTGPRPRRNDARSRLSRFDAPVPRLDAFASDLDRTLVRVGEAPSEEARAALRRVQDLGLRTLLVSGRRRPDLDPFVRGLRYLDAVVAENGAIIEAPLGSPLRWEGRAVARAVRARVAADPRLEAEVGDVVVSVPRAATARLRHAVAGLPVDLITNVGHTMALPRGITKGSGTARALRQLGVRAGRYAAIGDAENDLALLERAALSGAVANAEPRVQRTVDYVCRRRFEAGVLEFVLGPLSASVLARTS